MSRMAGFWRVLSFGVPFDAFNRDIWLICVSNVIGAFGEGLYSWVFPLYVRSLQADYVQLGLVLSALYGVSALTLIPGGLLADRFDRKRILILAWTPWIFAPLIFSFAVSWEQLIPGTICWAVSMVGVPAFNAYVITAVADKKKLASALSFVWSSYSFSYIFAPAVGGYLATIIEMRWVIRLAAIFAAISTCTFLFIHKQSPPRNRSETEKPVSSGRENQSRNKMVLWASFFALATFFMTVGRAFVPTFLNEEVKMSSFYVGLFGSISYAGTTLIGIATGRIGDRWRKSGAISLCLFFYFVSIASLIFVRDPVSLMFLAFLVGSSAVTGSLVSSFVGTIAPENKRGLWISVPQTLGLLATFAGPYLAGFLYSISYFYVFAVSASAIPLMALLALVCFKD